MKNATRREHTAEPGMSDGATPGSSPTVPPSRSDSAQAARRRFMSLRKW